jgi:hypothetical protein
MLEEFYKNGHPCFFLVPPVLLFTIKLTSYLLKITVFCCVMPHNLVDVYPLFHRNVLPPYSPLKMEEAYSSETLANIYQIIWHHIPGDSNLHNLHYKNFKLHVLFSAL